MNTVELDIGTVLVEYAHDDRPPMNVSVSVEWREDGTWDTTLLDEEGNWVDESLLTMDSCDDLRNYVEGELARLDWDMEYEYQRDLMKVENAIDRYQERN